MSMFTLRRRLRACRNSARNNAVKSGDHLTALLRQSDNLNESTYSAEFFAELRDAVADVTKWSHELNAYQNALDAARSEE